MAVEAAAAWYQELREVEYLQESNIKKMGSISRRLTMANDLSDAEVARLKAERRALREEVQRLALEMSPLPDFSCMTEAERAAAAEKLRDVEVNYALRLKQEGDSRGQAMEAAARIVDFDPKQGGLYYSRCTRGDLNQFILDEQSPIGPMRYIDSPYKKESDFLCLCTAVNFLTVKIASLDVGFPIRVYGTIIVRDSIDVRCVYHFRRDSEDSQLINSKFDSLVLTGPKRGLALTGDIYVETDLKIEDDLVLDRELSKGLIIIRNSSTGPSPLMTGYMFQTKSLATRLSTVDVNYTVVHRALEATIGVEVPQGIFLGRIIAYTSKMPQKLVLYDSEEADPTTVTNIVLELMRPVVCVHADDVLLIAALTSCDQSVLAFNPRINDRAEGSLLVTGAKLLVKLCWSVMNP